MNQQCYQNERKFYCKCLICNKLFCSENARIIHMNEAHDVVIFKTPASKHYTVKPTPTDIDNDNKCYNYSHHQF